MVQGYFICNFVMLAFCVTYVYGDRCTTPRRQIRNPIPDLSLHTSWMPMGRYPTSISSRSMFDLCHFDAEGSLSQVRQEAQYLLMLTCLGGISLSRYAVFVLLTLIIGAHVE